MARTKEQIVELFNETFPIGSICKLRKVARKEYPYQNYTVIAKAFVRGGNALCFFEELSGAFCIEPRFVKYPRKKKGGDDGI